MRLFPFRNVTLAAVFWVALSGCAQKDAPIGLESGAGRGAVTLPTPSPSASAAEVTDAPVPYPPGRWRGASADEIEGAVLWLSHILVRHDQVAETDVSFNLTGWRTAEPRSKRGRREALALAESIAQRAREQGGFEELARQYSEDAETRPRGGSLGAVTVKHLAVWPEVLDSLETLEAGGVSRVVETQYGYHVFQRRAPMAETTVSGARIVIGHDDAPWLELARRGPVPKRSREEAYALALRVYEDARKNPADFARLVQRYSEHYDAERDGDFGSWSTHEATGVSREVETLTTLRVGEIAQPFDSIFGFQIILRTANRPRPELAMSKIQLRFDPSLADGEKYSRASVQARASALLETVKRDPARFTTLQAELCCSDVFRVVAGRDVPDLNRTLERLKPGAIADRLVESPAVEFMIVRRLPESALSPRARARFELPVPRTAAPGSPG